MGDLTVENLKDSELRSRRLFEAAQDGIVILDAETGMVEDVNPYLIKMLGYSREEFAEKKLWNRHHPLRAQPRGTFVAV
jgi:PAS domain S-box-containing protein